MTIENEQCKLHSNINTNVLIKVFKTAIYIINEIIILTLQYSSRYCFTLFQNNVNTKLNVKCN